MKRPGNQVERSISRRMRHVAGKLDGVQEELRIQFAEDAARSLSEYHTLFIEPLIQLLEFYQQPWWRRIFRRPPQATLRPEREPASGSSEGGGADAEG